MLNISNYQTTFQYLSETNHQISFMSRGFAEILRVLEVCCTCNPCHTARSEIVRTEVVVPGFHPRVSKTTDQVKQKGSIEGIVLPSSTMDGTMDGPLAKPKMSETEDTGSVVWVSHCMIRFADDWHLASMFNVFLFAKPYSTSESKLNVSSKSSTPDKPATNICQLHNGT